MEMESVVKCVIPMAHLIYAVHIPLHHLLCSAFFARKKELTIKWILQHSSSFPKTLDVTDGTSTNATGIGIGEEEERGIETWVVSSVLHCMPYTVILISVFLRCFNQF
jgi:hypothetical protein